MIAIAGKPVATIQQMVDCCISKNSNPRITCNIYDLAMYFIEEGEVEGIRGDIAFAQSIVETGWLRYDDTGIVPHDYNNFCGLGALDGNKRGDCNKFDTARIGVRAQIQHLQAYATKEGTLLKMPCVDVRYKYITGATRGSAPYVEYLGKQENPSKIGWASGAGYGTKIINVLNQILAVPLHNSGFVPTPPVTEQSKPQIADWLYDMFKEAQSVGLIESPEYWEKKLGDNITCAEAIALVTKGIKIARGGI